MADECMYVVVNWLGECDDNYVIEKYNVELNEWTTVVDCLVDMFMYHHMYPRAIAVLDEKIYVSDVRSFACYDTSTNTWTSLASIRHDIERPGRHSLLVKDGSLIAVGGDVGAIKEYDVENDTWMIREDLGHQEENPEGGLIMMKYHLEMTE